MDRKFSNYLDIVRVIASFAVLFQHLSMYNNDVFAFFSNYGHPAVMGFFILSGYVIAFVADQREKTLDIYLKHRFARLYSVMIIAWLLTVILDTSGVLINNQTYEGVIASDNYLVRIFAHVFFLQQSWFNSIQFFSNQPLWSLAYEFWYYLLFGLIFLYKGRYKLGLIMVVALIMGPVILVYGAIWFAGAYLYKLHQKEFSINPALASLIFVISVPVIFSYPYWSHFLLPTDLPSVGKLSLRTYLDDIIFAFFIFINVFCFRYSLFSFSSIAPVIRFLSSISFSLYVFHFPLIFFFKAILTHYFSFSDQTLFFILALFIIASVYLLSFISERKKKAYYGFFEGLFKLFPSKIFSKER